MIFISLYLKIFIQDKIGGPMKKYVTIVGAVNIDITGSPYDKLNLNDSNPGYVKHTLGGVGRNIADNLARLAAKVELITVLGDDLYAADIKKDCLANNIGIGYTEVFKDARTSLYLCINDDEGEMKLALSDMDLYENISVDFLKKRIDFINESAACVIDTNIPKESIEYLVENVRVPIFVDTVSVKKTEKIDGLLHNIYGLKPNIYEAEVLSGMKIEDLDDMKKAANLITDSGVKNLFISMGKDGVYFKDEVDEGILPSLSIDIVNTTGAGDAFFAAIIWSYLQGYDIEESARTGSAASYICLQSQDTVSKEMSVDRIKQIKNDWRI